jgi:DNA-binding transcriptional regulator YdaS (Cro superfamily)
MKTRSEGMRKAIDLYGSHHALADAVGVARSTVTLWSLGFNRPGPLDAIRIEGATGGAVRREDLLEIFDRTWAKRNVFGGGA